MSLLPLLAAPFVVAALVYASRARARRWQEERLVSGGRKSFVLNLKDR